MKRFVCICILLLFTLVASTASAFQITDDISEINQSVAEISGSIKNLTVLFEQISNSIGMPAILPICLTMIYQINQTLDRQLSNISESFSEAKSLVSLANEIKDEAKSLFFMAFITSIFLVVAFIIAMIYVIKKARS